MQAIDRHRHSRHRAGRPQLLDRCLVVAGIAQDLALRLVKLGGKVRHLKNHGLEEGVSTRLLIYAGTLIREGVVTERACDVAIARPITDDPDMQRSILELAKAIF